MSLRSAHWIAFTACSSAVLLLSAFTPDGEDGLCDSPIVGGHTGAPGEVSCTGCHPGTANTGTAEIEWSIGDVGGTYIPGTLYTGTVKIKRPGRDKYGFVCLALEDAGNLDLGGFGLLETVRTRTYTDGPRHYVSHTPCGADAIDSTEWSFTWQAPATNVGNITIYMADLVANHDHMTSGDETYTRTITLTPSALGIASIVADAKDIRVFPNPASDAVQLRVPTNGASLVRFALVDELQRTIRRWQIIPSAPVYEHQLDLSGIPPQVLHLVIDRDAQRTVVPIVHE